MCSCSVHGRRPDLNRRPADADPISDALAELIEIGMNVARTVQFLAQTEAAKANDAPAGTCAQAAAHLADAFERAARAVRRTALLARHIDDPVSPQTQRRQVVRRRIARDVQDAIQRKTSDIETQEKLTAELRERLDSADLDLEIDHRPDDEIIREICRDLGLLAASLANPDWRRTSADIGRLNALANPPQKPRPPPDRPPQRRDRAAQSPQAQAPPSPS